MAFLYALPGAIAEGLIWGLMGIGVYISYKILDIADLTVDGSICTGACVCAVLLGSGVPVWVSVLAAFVAGALAGMVTGLLHTALGIPSILSGCLLYTSHGHPHHRASRRPDPGRVRRFGRKQAQSGRCGQPHDVRRCARCEKIPRDSRDSSAKTSCAISAWCPSWCWR